MSVGTGVSGDLGVWEGRAVCVGLGVWLGREVAVNAGPVVAVGAIGVFDGRRVAVWFDTGVLDGRNVGVLV